jgi:cell division protein ZapE
VLLSSIPRMSAGQASEARRFTWLVDVLYDNRVHLIASAEAPPEQLYVAGALTNEFARTVSRLHEMQSREYLEAPRRSVVARA